LGVLYPFTRTKIKNAFGRGAEDVTIEKMDEFNFEHPGPPASYQIQVQSQSLTITNPSYFSTSGNADLDQNPNPHKLEDNEAAPYGTVGIHQWGWIGNVEYVTVGTNGGKKVVIQHLVAPGGFFDNDTVLSVLSARYPPPSPAATGFTEINGTPYLANHASILCPQAGLQPAFCVGIRGTIVDVLTNIRQAEKNLNVQVQ
jgi:hypothetical protein